MAVIESRFDIDSLTRHTHDIEKLIEELYSILEKEISSLKNVNISYKKELKKFTIEEMMKHIKTLWVNGKVYDDYIRRKICRTAYVIKWLEALGYNVRRLYDYPNIIASLLLIDAAINYMDDSLDKENLDRGEVISTYSFLFQLPYLISSLLLNTIYDKNGNLSIKNFLRSAISGKFNNLVNILNFYKSKFPEWYFTLLTIPFYESELYNKFGNSKELKFSEIVSLYDVRKRDVDPFAETILEIVNLKKEEKEKLLNILRDLRAYQLIKKDYDDREFDIKHGVKSPTGYFSEEIYKKLMSLYEKKIITQIGELK